MSVAGAGAGRAVAIRDPAGRAGRAGLRSERGRPRVTLLSSVFLVFISVLAVFEATVTGGL